MVPGSESVCAEPIAHKEFSLSHTHKQTSSAQTSAHETHENRRRNCSGNRCTEVSCAESNWRTSKKANSRVIFSSFSFSSSFLLAAAALMCVLHNDEDSSGRRGRAFAAPSARRTNRSRSQSCAPSFRSASFRSEFRCRGGRRRRRPRCLLELLNYFY